MIFPRRLVVTLVLAFTPSLALAASTPTRAKPTRPAPAAAGSYRGAIVMDAATGKVLLEENADVVSPPASMTKLMTFAVLFDKLKSGALTLATPIRITADDARMGGTEVFLDPRETFSVEELIYAMMIQSANDAAHALARGSTGSIPAFVELMNAKARELGMTHTTFRSPHGLPPDNRKIADGDLTTPRDYALLSRYVLLNTDVLKYTSVRERDFAPNRPKGPQHMENHNKLLGKVAGVDGLKTGYTAGAGYCLAATAQRNGHRVIVVIMGSFGPKGHEIDQGHARDLKSIELLEHGFAALPPDSPAFAAAASATPAGVASPISLAPTPPGQPASTATDTSPAIKFSIPPAKK